MTRLALLPFGLLLSAACVPTDTGLTLDPGDPPPPIYEGIGPQTMVCTHFNCCAIIDGAIVCEGEPDNYGLWNAPGGSDWVGLESNPRYLCAWDAVGDWTCWGDEPNPLTAEVPDVLVADIRLGTAGGVALLLDGSLELWGSDFFGQLSDAPGLAGPYIAVEAGYGWMCAAAESGKLFCWGIEDGEGVDATEHAQVTDAPTSGTASRSFRGLNRGVGDVLSGIDVEDRVYSWGGGYEFTGPLNEVFAQNVAPSDGYLCAHLPGGTLACLGNLLGEAPDDNDVRAQPITSVEDVACGHLWCCAVVEGCFECWGQDQVVQTAHE